MLFFRAEAFSKNVCMSDGMYILCTSMCVIILVNAYIIGPIYLFEAFEAIFVAKPSVVP